MNTVYSINGPVVKVKQSSDFKVMEMVFVGENRLLGEVISISDDFTVIQVYESTVGLKPGEEIIGTGESISVTLGPGLLTNIFDGTDDPEILFQVKIGIEMWRFNQGTNLCPLFRAWCFIEPVVGSCVLPKDTG